MDTESALALALATLALGLAPGPGVIALLARSLTLGARGAWPFVAGLLIGDLVYLACAMLGLSVIANEFADWFIALRLVGGAYLVYLGLRMILSCRTDSYADTAVRRGFLPSLLAGLGITLGNPKVIVFYLAFLPAFLDLSDPSAMDALVAAAVVLLALTSALSLYVVAGAKAKRWVASPPRVRRVNRAAGVLMAGAGIAVAAG